MPLVIDHASQDPRFRDHPGLAAYGVESYVGVPIVRTDGSVFGTLCALDVEPKRSRPDDLDVFVLFAELISQQLDAAELADERELFIGAVGHDLRGPIQAIAHGAQLIELTAKDRPEAVAAATRIRRSAGRLGSMVSDMLDMTRGRLGQRMAVAPERLEVSDLLGHCAADVIASADRPRLQVEVAGEETVTWDRDRIQQLLQNLIANACQHGDPGHPVIVRFDGTADPVTLSVHNRGEPIEPALLPRLFDPFVRSATRRVPGGLGLGLYIVTQIARAHDGQVTARSRAGEGTEFLVTLPRNVGSNPPGQPGK